VEEHRPKTTEEEKVKMNNRNNRMTRTGRSLAAMCLLIFVLSAPALAQTYEEAIRQSAVFDAQNGIRKLRSVAADIRGYAQMVAFTYHGRFQPGSVTLPGDVWVTTQGEVQETCKRFDREALQFQIYQLLGLPANTNYTDFVRIDAKIPDIFRPTPDPRITTEYPCELQSGQIPANCGNVFPGDASQDHKAWIATQALNSYHVGGYPWTHVGYTYWWGPHKGGDVYGASEYVIRKGSQVEVLEVVDCAKYCAP
jgi:hypothetical protein